MASRVHASQTQVFHEPGVQARVSFLGRIKDEVVSWWHRIQIGRRSEYSVERLLSFRDYYERTSVAHAVAVCILAPMPALLTTIVLDSLPLQAPADGWRANYCFWIRMFLETFVALAAAASEVREVSLVGAISRSAVFKIGVSAALSNVGCNILVAALWKFPIPFGYVLLFPPCLAYFAIGIITAIGPGVLARTPLLRQHLKAHLLIIACHGIVAVCYPVFNAVFNRVSVTAQSFTIFLMPMIKFIAKHIVANAAETYHELLGSSVVFCVDLFNVFYVAICMQGSKSWITTVLIMATDSFHLVVALNDIVRSNNHDKQVQEPYQSTGRQPEYYLRDLPVMIRKVFHGGKASHLHFKHIRLLAPFSLPLSSHSQVFMAELTKTGRFANDQDVSRRRSTKRELSSAKQFVPVKALTSMAMAADVKQHQVAPATIVAVFHAKIQRGGFVVADLRDASTISAVSPGEEAVHDALQTLFHAEYILLAEYLEVIVPILYALYLAAMFQLPVAAYYPHTASMTSAKLNETIARILIYSAMEFVGFVVLVVLLTRKFGFCALYQVAFVLEVQAPTSQVQLLIWTIVILHLTLVHNGVDFNIAPT